MNIPEKIQIIGQTYDVKKVNEFKHSNTTGDIDTSSGVIKIDCSMSDESQSIAFLHEVVHGALYSIYAEHNEQYVEVIAQVMYQVFNQITKKETTI